MSEDRYVNPHTVNAWRLIHTLLFQEFKQRVGEKEACLDQMGASAYCTVIDEMCEITDDDRERGLYDLMDGKGSQVSVKVSNTVEMLTHITIGALIRAAELGGEDELLSKIMYTYHGSLGHHDPAVQAARDFVEQRLADEIEGHTYENLTDEELMDDDPEDPQS